MYLFKLHIFIKEDLQLPILFLSLIFRLNHSLEVGILVELGPHLFDVAFGLPNLGQVCIKFRLLLKNNFVFGRLGPLIQQLFSFFNFESAVDKVFELFYNGDDHVSQFQVLLIQGHEVFLLFACRSLACEIDHAWGFVMETLKFRDF